MGQQGSWDSRRECVYAWTDHLQSNIGIQSLGQSTYADSKDTLKYLARHLRW